MEDQIRDYLLDLSLDDYTGIVWDAIEAGANLDRITLYNSMEEAVEDNGLDVVDIMRITKRFDLDPDYEHAYFNEDGGAWGTFDDITDDPLLDDQLDRLIDFIVENQDDNDFCAEIVADAVSDEF